MLDSVKEAAPIPRVTPLQVRVRMLEMGLTQGRIARRLKVSVNSINGVLRGRWRSSRLQRQIAHILGFPVKSMFPDHDPSVRRGRRRPTPTAEGR